MRIVWLRSAQSDIKLIQEYYEEVASKAVADQQVLKVIRSTRILEAHPYAGHTSSLDDSGEILEWVIPKTSYILPYSVMEDEILIYRVFDARQERPESWDE